MSGDTLPGKAGASLTPVASLERRLEDRFAESGSAHAINARVLVFALLDAPLCMHVLGTVIAYLCKAVLTVASPLAIYALLSWFKDPEAPLGLGCLFAGLNTGAILGQHFAHMAYTLRGARAGERSQMAVAGILYRRTLHLNAAIARRYQMGELVNLLSSDCGNLADFWTGAILLFFQAFEVIAISCIMWLVVAEATCVALAFCLGSYVGLQFFGRWVAGYQFSQSKLVDERLKLLGEILYGIKVVKANGWVPRFQSRISRIGEQESIFSLRKKRSMGQVLFWTSEIIDVMAFAVCTVSVLVLHQEPDASRLFTIWIFIGVLHSKLFACPEAVRKVSSAWTSLKRCAHFFEGSKAGCRKYVYLTEAENDGLSIQNGSFGFMENSDAEFSSSGHNHGPPREALMKTILADVNLTLERNHFYAVVGRVGCGKTSLLLALLGEMQTSQETKFGNALGHSRIAYVPQDPVIFNDTVRENICFGVPFDVERYHKVCSCCALDHDVSLFPHGDASVIGSRGINISGGQQARICLARSLYSDADVHLLDDPLAKLDARVSAEVLTNAILGLLRDRTRIMVTNNVNVVRVANFLIRVDAGAVTLDGHVDACNVDFIDCENCVDDTPCGIESYAIRGNSEEEDISPASLCVGVNGCPPKKGTLCHRACFFWHHYSAGLSSSWHAAVYLLVELTEVFVVEAGVYVLACWCDDPQQEHHSHAWYARMYAAAVITEILVVQSKLFYLANCTQRSVDVLHKSLLVCVLRSSLSWLQGVPVGHILQMFSGTLARIDDRVFHVSELLALMSMYLVAICVISCVMFPPIAIALLPLAIAFVFLFSRLLKADGSTKHSESSLRRLLVHQYTETLSGLVLVRNFPGASERFLKVFDGVLQSHAVAKYKSVADDASVLLEFSLLGGLAYVCAGWSLVLSHGAGYLSPGEAGFMLTNCVFLSFMCVETVFNSLLLLEVAQERESIYSLLQSVPQELPDYTTQHRAMLGWPSSGLLSFENLEVRYKSDLPSVIRDFKLEVHGGEHLGIVGRTGSGKSSLLLAICRLIEPTCGRILIDGVDISCIGLQELRPHLGILSQDPLFFGGSLRENLDPFSEHHDDYIWQVLDDVGLLKLFSIADYGNSTDGLGTLITELGGNFSVGQRQLLCLARAALRTPRVVLVDEATAALDMEADMRVQTVLESRFSGRGATVLQVAHRLWSVAASSRIAVLENGLLAALGTPCELLSLAPSGSPIFKAMVAALGEQEAARFHSVAAAAAGQASGTISSI